MVIQTYKRKGYHRWNENRKWGKFGVNKLASVFHVSTVSAAIREYNVLNGINFIKI